MILLKLIYEFFNDKLWRGFVLNERKVKLL